MTNLWNSQVTAQSLNSFKTNLINTGTSRNIDLIGKHKQISLNRK